MTRALLALSVVVASSAGTPASAADPASNVDPFIGTMGSGFVFPGPAAPYGMVQLSPDTNGYFAYTGYQWIDDAIRGFSHVHVESMGVREGGAVPFMPTTGAVSTNVFDYESVFSHASEEAEPGYYAVTLEEYGVRAELTAGTRVGMHRYTFPATTQSNVLLDVGRQIAGGSDTANLPHGGAGAVGAEVTVVGDRTITGTANTDPEDRDEYTVHFAARFDRPFGSFGVWDARGGAPHPGAEAVGGEGAGAYATFDTTVDRDVVVKVGISFVDVAGALANLEDELPGEDFDFDALRAKTRARWNEALSVIEVGPSAQPSELTSFTTALYHAQHHPNAFSDADGRYRGHDDAVHAIGEPGDPMPADSTYYANFSMWDTYRAEMPLLMLIAPERIPDMMRSMAAIVAHGGEMPRWALQYKNPNYMNGEPGLQVIADAFCRGLVPADALGTLYGEARRVALEARREPSFYAPGYTAEASATLEYALGDFALALMADALGEEADRDALVAQAGHWRNLIDPESGFVRPRDPATGEWQENYRPELPDGFREGTGWQYSWLVPHDVRGLYDAMGEGRGGDDLVLQRLDTFFSGALTGTMPPAEAQQKLTAYGIAYYGNQYAPSNEHDLQAPWMYDWTGEPWKTQAIQRAYQALYRPLPDGLPGNDDLGTMSAWFVWSALGFYPMIPGAPLYVAGSPLFEQATIHLPGGDFVVRAPGASATSKFVQSASLNGDPLEAVWFGHDALEPGGSIEFAMGVAPSAWGSGPEARPPSASTTPLAGFGCAP